MWPGEIPGCFLTMKVSIENAMKLLGDQKMTFFEFRSLLITEMGIRRQAAEVLMSQLQLKKLVEMRLVGSKNIYLKKS